MLQVRDLRNGSWALASYCFLIFCLPVIAQAGVPARDPGIYRDPQADPRSLAAQPVQVQTIVELTNQDRAAQGLGALAWSPELTTAALAHAHRMAEAAELSHRYSDEADLAARAADVGAHFSRIAENIAEGFNSRAIEKQWMTSVPHRMNILDPAMTAIGVGVVATGGMLYAVEDFSQAQEELSPAAVETKVMVEIRSLLPSGTAVLADHALEEARRECTRREGLAEGSLARFVLRWEGSTLQAPQPLIDAVRSGRYTSAGVGACPPLEGINHGFTVYRVAVLLY